MDAVPLADEVGGGAAADDQERAVAREGCGGDRGLGLGAARWAAAKSCAAQRGAWDADSRRLIHHVAHAATEIREGEQAPTELEQDDGVHVISFCRRVTHQPRNARFK
jgi:hypothetical protein